MAVARANPRPFSLDGFEDGGAPFPCIVGTISREWDMAALNRRGALASCGDQDLMREAVSNLVDNAIKVHARGRHGADRGPRMAEEPPVISVRSHTVPASPLEERERIFQRFHRGERSGDSPGHRLQTQHRRDHRQSAWLPARRSKTTGPAHGSNSPPSLPRRRRLERETACDKPAKLPPAPHRARPL